jgi:formate/nitrite transporter FocA (FNT family)
MADHLERKRFNSERFVRRAAIVFAVGYSVHALDHLRRGFSASPTQVMIVGAIQGVFVAIAIWMALAGKRRAPVAAVLVGFGSALLFTYGHLIPELSLDSFVTAPHPTVTWFSWLSAVTEIGTGIVFGIAGVRALLMRDRALLSAPTVP